MNGRSVRQILQTVYRKNDDTDQQSFIQSTIVPSEIDCGATRMKKKTGLRMATPSCIESTIVPSEIDRGVTRMQMKNGLKIAPPSEITNGNAHNVDGNRSNGRRHMPPMPAGHETDIENFRKYNS